MTETQKQILAVWGSPNSGKTTISVKLAAELAKQKKNVVIVHCDMITPSIPTLLRNKQDSETSMGTVLSAPSLTQELIYNNLVPYDKIPYIALLGYKSGDNVYTYAEYTKERAVDMLVLLRHIADYVIVDCSSALHDNILSIAALEIADEILRLCSCDLKSISYYSSYLPLISDRRFHAEQHIKVLTNLHSYEGGAEYENAFGGVKYSLPYLPEIEAQAATMNLCESLSGKVGKTYEDSISAMIKEVFHDGKSS